MTNDVSYRKVLCLLAGAVVLLMVVLAPKPRAAYAEAAPAEQNEAIDPTQWVAVDDLGRTVATYEDTGAPRQDRYVGIFYWTWHYNFAGNKAVNVNNVIKEHPEALHDYNAEIWKTESGQCWWNESIYGYYSSTDKYVLRKQMELLADAGVDVLFFDCTNGTFLWEQSCYALFEVILEAREDGINAPRVCFMLRFAANSDSKQSLNNLYKRFYSKEKYQDLWFYWEGKPLIMAHPDNLSPESEREKEILDFFTFRKNWAGYFDGDQSSEYWGWLSVYPQAKYLRPDGTVEQMTVGVAQNASEHGLVAMNDYRGGVYGRAYSSDIDGKYSYTYTYRDSDITVDSDMENAHYYGVNFQQQWDYALETDPTFIFVTGWNEWTMGRFETWQDSPNAFPDQFNDEYSRDCEPSKGDLKDFYYYQLVSNIRKFKGSGQPVRQNEKHTIDINGDLSQWDSIYTYNHYANNTPARDAKGFGSLHYESDTMRNDIIKTKAAYDDDNIYFYVETAETLTPSSDPAWMRLFIDTGAATADSTDWEEFEFVVNRQNPDPYGAYLERSTGGWNWETVCQVPYSIQDNVFQLAIPREALGLTGNTLNFNFKWSDNMQPVDGVEGDIMDFYLSGDVAPGGRFAFRFTTDEIIYAPDRATSSVRLILGIAAAAVVLICAAITIPIVVKRRKAGKQNG